MSCGLPISGQWPLVNWEGQKDTPLPLREACTTPTVTPISLQRNPKRCLSEITDKAVASLWRSRGKEGSTTAPPPPPTSNAHKHTSHTTRTHAQPKKHTANGWEPTLTHALSRHAALMQKGGVHLRDFGSLSRLHSDSDGRGRRRGKRSGATATRGSGEHSLRGSGEDLPTRRRQLWLVFLCVRAVPIRRRDPLSRLEGPRKGLNGPKRAVSEVHFPFAKPNRVLREGCFAKRPKFQRCGWLLFRFPLLWSVV